MRWRHGWIVAALLLAAANVALAQTQTPPEKPGSKPLTRQLQMSACYVKEDADVAWQVRIVGQMPRGPGIYVIVYNEAGEVVRRAEVPFGTHREDKPFTIAVPADGKAQQYVIKFLGQQDNLNGMSLPLTDLPHEVYGDQAFSFGYGDRGGLRRIVAFQVEDDKPYHMSGYGHFRVLDSEGAVVLDSKQKALPQGDPAKKGGAREIEVITPLTPGKVYWLEPYDLMYWSVRDRRVYLTFDPGRWFAPKLNWTLADRPWWKGMP